MSSIFVKSLIWFLLTFIVCLTGSAITMELRSKFAPGRRDFLSRSVSFQLAEARMAYETGGSSGLQAYFVRLRKFLPGDYALLDSTGKDLVTGADRHSELPDLHKPPPSPLLFPFRMLFRQNDRMAMAWPSRDNKYTLLLDTGPPGGPWSPLPSYLWIAFATTVFYYILAVQLAGPVRTLEQTVERFGRGDLAIRASTKKRRDEIGKLAKAFNVMADRIETLLTAERRLLQDVSHELRSPLARLEFAVELARTSPDKNRALDRIKKEVGRLSTLVSELLQVTRAENDPESRNLEQIGLPSLLRDVVEDSNVEAEARNCQLVLDAPDPISIKGDRELLRRAVENIVRNAIRYAPEGTRVEISLQRNRDSATISIRDYGPGVPEESLTNLFKPFFRVEPDRSRTTNGGGVGLGLSIAQRAIAVHMGAITATNAKPGLAVKIELPFAATPVEISVA